MKINKKMKRIVKIMRRMQKNYRYLTPKQKHDYWKAVEKMEMFIDNLEYPTQIIEI